MKPELLKNLQDQIHAWHLRNYPKDDAESALLGIGEELGELMRVELKQTGGIRGDWNDWQTKKRKEIGDVLIGILNFCGYVNALVYSLPPTEVLEYYFEQSQRISTKMCLLSISTCLTNIINMCVDMIYLPSQLTREERNFPSAFARVADQMILELAQYARRNGFDLEMLLVERWATISQRDFIANPQTGGREKESLVPEYEVPQNLSTKYL